VRNFPQSRAAAFIDEEVAGMNATHPSEPSTFDRAKPIALGLLLAVLGVAGLRLLEQLQHVLVLLFLAVLFASAISRPVARLERRRVPRGVATAIVQLAAMAVFLGLAWVVVPPLVTQLRLFVDDSPSYVTRFHHLRQEYLSVKRHYPEAGTFDSEVSAIAAKLATGVGGRLVDLPLTAAQLLFNLSIIYVLSTMLVIRRERMLDNMLALVTPAKRERTRLVMEKIWFRLGAYLLAKAVVMVCVGVLMYVALRVLDVPFAVPLSVIVAFGELVPRIGVWIARIPLLAVAAFQGPTTLLLTFLASAVIEELKADVIAPRAEGQALDMDPLLTLLAVLCGSALLGWEGALIAVPVAAVVQVILEEVVVPARLAKFDEQPQQDQPQEPATASREAAPESMD
jgi:predicted PurR-regulated permease PerM